MEMGIYFKAETNEITRVSGSNQPEPGWLHVSQNARLGLLAVRRILAERGLVSDPREVYWYFPQPVEETKPAGFCEVADSTPNSGVLARRRTAVRGIGGRPLSGGAPSS